jgi:hypothetical protein
MNPIPTPPKASQLRLETSPLEGRTVWTPVENEDADGSRQPANKHWWPIEEGDKDAALALLTATVYEPALVRLTYARADRRRRVGQQVGAWYPAEQVWVEGEHLESQEDEPPAPLVPTAPTGDTASPPATAPRKHVRVGEVGGVPVTPVDLGAGGMRSDFALAHALTQQGQDKMLHAMTQIFGTCIQVVTSSARSQVAVVSELAKLHLARAEEPTDVAEVLRQLSAEQEERTRALLEDYHQRDEQDEADDLREQLRAITEQIGAGDQTPPQPNMVASFVGSEHGQALIATALNKLLSSGNETDASTSPSTGSDDTGEA